MHSLADPSLQASAYFVKKRRASHGNLAAAHRIGASPLKAGNCQSFSTTKAAWKPRLLHCLLTKITLDQSSRVKALKAAKTVQNLRAWRFF
jgi:hypothetical protein